MKGAITEPWAKISNPPSNNMTNIIGKSQIFFLALSNLNSSDKNDMAH